MTFVMDALLREHAASPKRRTKIILRFFMATLPDYRATTLGFLLIRLQPVLFLKSEPTLRLLVGKGKAFFWEFSLPLGPLVLWSLSPQKEGPKRDQRDFGLKRLCRIRSAGAGSGPCGSVGCGPAPPACS